MRTTPLLSRSKTVLNAGGDDVGACVVTLLGWLAGAVTVTVGCAGVEPAGEVKATPFTDAEQPANVATAIPITTNCRTSFSQAAHFRRRRVATVGRHGLLSI
jgi:hypothetical protein